MVGGKLYEELSKTKFKRNFEEWALQARLARKMKVVDTGSVSAHERQIRRDGYCVSDDEHVLALAQASGARLLYSNDTNLHRDFKDSRIIKNPRGKIYSTVRSKEVSDGQRRLLGRKDLCDS